MTATGPRAKPEATISILITLACKTSLRSTSAKDCRENRSEEHTSELQSLMRISYAVFCLKKKMIPSHNMTTYTRTTSNIETYNIIRELHTTENMTTIIDQ